MNILSAIYGNENNTVISVSLDNETVLNVPVSNKNRHYKKLMEWDDAGGVIAPYAAPDEPTDDEIYNQTMQNNKLIKALALSLNSAGAFSVEGNVLSNSELKGLIKSNM